MEVNLSWLTVTYIRRYVLCCSRAEIYLEHFIYILGDFIPKKLRARKRRRCRNARREDFSPLFFKQKGKEANVTTKNLAFSPGCSRIQTHGRQGSNVCRGQVSRGEQGQGWWIWPAVCGTCQVFVYLLPPERSGVKPKLPPCCAQRYDNANTVPQNQPTPPHTQI